MKRLVILIAILVALPLLFLAQSGPVNAAAITVTTTDDELNADGDCSLREAIQAANTDAAVDACTAGSGSDTITLPAGTYTFSITGPHEEANAAGDLNILDDLTINGAGAANSIIDGAALDRVFRIPFGKTVEITGVTIQNGSTTGGTHGSGGGIYNDGALTLNNSAVNGSTDVFTGGGIYSGGSLTLNSSTVSGNSANLGGGILIGVGTLNLTDSTVSGNTARNGGGGGIVLGQGSGTAILDKSTISGNTSSGHGGGVFNGSTLTLTNSTVSGNNTTTGVGGGIFNDETGTLTLSNSTVANNSAVISFGGGIFNWGTVTLTNSTVSGNTAGGPGGGIFYGVGTVTLKNTIVAGNPLGGDCGGLLTFTSLGHNLSGDGSCDLLEPTDLPGVDPVLGLLQDNGGPTQTHALLPGSPAIDSGDDVSAPSTDQRGVARPNGAASDIGAFEFEHNIADLRLAKTVDDPAPDIGQTVRFVVIVTNDGPDAANKVEVTDVLDGLVFDVPAAMTSESQGFYDTTTGLWDVGTLAVGGNATLTIDTEVQLAAGGQSTVNQAEVTNLDEFDPDSVPNDGSGDDFDSAVVDVNPTTDLSVSISESADPVVAGDPVTYTVTVINNGPIDANGVSLTGSTSVVATLTSLASQTSCSVIGDTFSCDLDVLEVGSELILTVGVTTDAPGTITASANVSANEFDHVPSNNDAAETTTVTADCTLVLSPTYVAGILTVEATVGTSLAATKNIWGTAQSTVLNLESAAIPVTDPPATTQVFSGAVPAQGVVAVFATLTTPELGIICSDFKTVDTGAP